MAAEPDYTPHDILAAFISDSLDNGDIVPMEEARKIAFNYSREYPEAWTELLGLEATRMIYHALRSGLESRRQRARKHAKAALFGEAAATGDIARLGIFRLWRCEISDDHTQRRLGEMTREDHTFVADHFQKEASSAVMLESFHRVLARRIPAGKTTEDVLDETTVLRIYDELTSR